MKQTLLLLLILVSGCVAAQNNVKKTAGINYTQGTPTHLPNENNGSELAVDTITGYIWQWHRTTGPTALGDWIRVGQGIDRTVGGTPPAYAPFRNQSWFAINGSNELYHYSGTGTTWDLVSGGGGGATYTAGTGIAISGSNVISNTGDLSNTNELQNLSLAGQALGISGGTGVTLPLVGATASDFDLASGVLSLDYTNAQKATSLVPGFLTASDWSTFNGKQAAGNYITGLTGDVTATGPGSVAATVTRINGTSLAGLATGILKNTTTTGVPSIAVAADFPTLNQNTTGNAATVTTNANLSGPVTSVGNLTSIANGAITNAMLANSAVANLSGTNTGDNAVNSLYSGLVSNATHTGDASGATSLVVTGINNTNLAGLATGILKNTTSTGVPSIAVAADFPTLNQNTTGSAATLTTPRTIYGNSFNGSANLSQIIASTFGGTGNGFTAFTGPTTSEKVFTLPNASATILTTNAAVTIPQGGTGATTQQGGINALAGAVTSGSYLRGNGTNVVMSTIQAADVPTLNQNTSGNAGTATALQTGRTIAMTGDVTWTSPAFDGTANVTAAGTLANTAVTPGSYTSANITVDAKGRITAASNGSGGGGGGSDYLGTGFTSGGGSGDIPASTVATMLGSFEISGGTDLTLNPGGNIVIGEEGATQNIFAPDGTGVTAGGGMNFKAGSSDGDGGSMVFESGSSNTDGNGGDVFFTGGGSAEDGNGGDFFFTSGASVGGISGNMTMIAANGVGGGNFNMSAGGSSGDGYQGGGFQLNAGNATGTNGPGGNFSMAAGYAVSGQGGNFTMESGNGGAGNGGNFTMNAGGSSATGFNGGSFLMQSGNSDGGDGGDFLLKTGYGGDSNIGGDIFLFPSSGGSGFGYVKITNSLNEKNAVIDVSAIDTNDKTFSYPNQSGTLAVITSGTAAPTSTPVALGQIFIDTANAKVYISTGTASSADWKILN